MTKSQINIGSKYRKNVIMAVNAIKLIKSVFLMVQNFSIKNIWAQTLNNQIISKILTFKVPHIISIIFRMIKTY